MPLWVTILNIAIYAIAGLFVLFGLFIGWQRGVWKQLVRTVTLAGSAVLSFILTKTLYNFAYDFCKDKTPWEILEATKIPTVFHLDANLIAAMQNMDAASSEYVVPLILSFLILPFIFALLFAVIGLLMLLIYRTITVLFDYGDHGWGDITRFFGSILGAAQSAVIVMILLVPLAGLLSFSEQTVATVQENDPDSAATETLTEYYENNLAPLNGNLLVDWTQQYGGDLLCTYFAKVEIDGEETNMREEAQAVVRIYARVSYMSKNTAWDNLSSADKATVEAIIADLTANPYLSHLSASVLNGTTGVLQKQVGRADDIEEPLKTLLDNVVATFSEISSDTLAEDLGTVKNVYFLLSDTGVLAAMNDCGNVTVALSATDAEGRSVMARAMDLLNENERAKAIVDALTDISFAVLLDRLDMDEEAWEKIRAAEADILAALNDALALDPLDYADHASYVAAIEARIGAALETNGIRLEAETLNGIAEYIADDSHFTDAEGNRLASVTGEKLFEFAIAYFDNAAQEN